MGSTHIGEAIAHYRSQRGWSQRELAEASGVSASAVSLIERGDRPNPGLLTIMAIERALKLPHGRLSRGMGKAGE